LPGGIKACWIRSIENGTWSFCKLCHGDILRSKIPRFSALNSVNVVMCHDYPAVLKNLTLAEECVIARRHPVGSILKLRPGNRRSPSNYYALERHLIVFPQDPGNLLQILPSPILRFQDIIKVFWVGKLQPSDNRPSMENNWLRTTYKSLENGFLSVSFSDRMGILYYHHCIQKRLLP
jgi:hypothetical protein